MADGDISLLAIYDRVASVDIKVETLGADVRAQLSSGQRRMEDHEARVRSLERAVPEKLAERLEVLEDSAQRRSGMSGLLTVIVSLLGSSGATALISWLMRGHP